MARANEIGTTRAPAIFSDRNRFKTASSDSIRGSDHSRNTDQDMTWVSSSDIRMPITAEPKTSIYRPTPSCWQKPRLFPICNGQRLNEQKLNGLRHSALSLKILAISAGPMIRT
ncbi:MAG: hypothetical protein DMF61_04505 [Blastocatellia bacterium AA13]|nr:MAG: hypothetical protein DMF61_04505 [Blastocatellia bacterium AA13]